MRRGLNVTLLALLLLLAACGAQGPAAPASAVPAAPASGDAAQRPPTAAPTETPAPPTVTPSPEAAANAPCGYTWASADAPGVPEKAQAALTAAGVRATAVRASVYGENCVDPQSGAVREFLPMGTTVEVELPVTDLADQDALGTLAAQVVAALAGIGETPGPMPEARLIFAAGQERKGLQFKLADAQDRLAEGLTGGELLRALGYAP